MSKDLPSIPEAGGLHPEVRRALVRMREELQGLMGTRGNDGAVRFSQVVGATRDANGVLVVLPGFGTGGGPAEEPDLTPPPTPTFGVGNVVAGIAQVIVTWEGIGYTQGHGNKQTVVYAVKKDPSDPTMPTFPGSAGIVAVAPHALTIVAIPSEPNTRWHVWLKFESVDGVQSTTPAGGTNGVQATTGQDVAHLLTILTGQIRETQLYSTLGSRINLIDAADTVAGSVAARVKAERDARIQGDADTLEGAVNYTESYAYPNEDGEQVAIDLHGLIAQVNNPTTGLPATRAKLLAEYATIAGPTNSLASVTTALQAFATGAANTAQSNAESYTNDYAYSDENGIALAGSVSALTAKVIAPSASAGANYNPTYAALVAEASARATLDGNVRTLYTVRTEVSAGGRTVIGGFGLAGTAGGAEGPRIDFGVRADTFFVEAPNTGGQPTTKLTPFVIRTSTTTEGGVSVPAGVYMDAAYIVNLTAMYARIASLVADSISAGQINAANLTLGDGTVGGNLKSTSYTGGSGSSAGTGWLLQPGGNAYFNNAVVYGTVYASAGVFAGSLSAATGTFAGSLSAASGSFTGSLSGANITGATGTFSGSLNINSGGSDRMEITSTRIKIFNGGVERVRLGDLS